MRAGHKKTRETPDSTHSMMPSFLRKGNQGSSSVEIEEEYILVTGS
ncbi:hypothetical protein N665_0076s0246 [Sinapis alba]|nr:hypothetical protein N665_0076s0246 [Sinapis alba]